MLPSFAQPNLTQPVDFSVIHQKASGFEVIQKTFDQDAPIQTDGSAFPTDLANVAKPRHYQVWLAMPNPQEIQRLTQHSTKPTYHILYLLDGNAAIDDIDQTRLQAKLKATPAGQIPILVFIGYQTPYRFEVTSRAYDFTPPLLSATNDQIANAFVEEGRGRLNGGSENFYQLIERDIKPWVASQLQDYPKVETLWGHSYGGLFVLYHLFLHPQSFDHFVSADPSLWWQNGEMLKYWRQHQTLSKFATTKPLRLDFSQSATQEDKTPDSDSCQKRQFANEICNYYQDCQANFYQQSHGEVFTSSLLKTIAQF